MEKRFIVINCETLSDQWECDADRKIQPMLYTEEEVKTLFHKKSYYNALTGEKFASAKECKADVLVDYDSSIEVYEIKGNALIFRKDLSTFVS